MIIDILRNIEQKMKKTIEALRIELSSIRTGRAAPALVEHLKVEYAGVPTALNQIAGISAPEARLLVIQPWDRSCVHDIEKAILKSDLGLTPVSDGTLIRINIPSLTEERRQELMKVVRKRVEEKKIALRNLRRDGIEDIKKLEKNKEISQDELKRATDQLQKLTDSCTVNVEQVGRDKEAELAEV